MGYLRQEDWDLSDPSYISSDANAYNSEEGVWLYQDGDTTTTDTTTTTGGVDWKVSNCCGTYEIVFLCLMAACEYCNALILLLLDDSIISLLTLSNFHFYVSVIQQPILDLVIIYFLWNTMLMKPMKLIAVFVHEMGHATACWMTCGKVKGIEVYGNEGGVTKYVGGWRWFIIPAGYVGGSFWGAFFVVLSGNRWGALAAAILFCIAMCVSLFYSPNKTMVFLNLGFITLTGKSAFVLFIV